MTDTEWRDNRLLILSKLDGLDEHVEKLNALLTCHMAATNQLHSRVVALDTKVKVFFTFTITILAPFCTVLGSYIVKHF